MNISNKRYYRDLIVRIIEDAIALYIMGVLLWAICWLAGEILGKLGVG